MHSAEIFGKSTNGLIRAKAFAALKRPAAVSYWLFSGVFCFIVFTASAVPLQCPLPSAERPQPECFYGSGPDVSACLPRTLLP